MNRELLRLKKYKKATENLLEATLNIPEHIFEVASDDTVKLNKEDFIELLTEHYSVVRTVYDRARRKPQSKLRRSK